MTAAKFPGDCTPECITTIIPHWRQTIGHAGEQIYAYSDLRTLSFFAIYTTPLKQYEDA